MSEFAYIDRELNRSERSIKLRSGTIQIWKVVSVLIGADPVLRDNVALAESVHPAVGWGLPTSSLPVLVRLAHILIEASNPTHAVWIQHETTSSLHVREDFIQTAMMIQNYLLELALERDSMTPHQRLCNALRYRAEDLMRDFLKSHGLEPHELSRINVRIDRGEWPRSLLKFIPLPAWKKSIARRMMDQL